MSIHVSTENRWLVRYCRAANPVLRLVCLPFAGASASVFRSWCQYLPENIEVAAVQLPGRENRLRDPCVRDIHEIAAQLDQGMTESFDIPFAFFGHSLGALIGYELLQRLQERGQGLAEVFFASGAPAPHTRPGPLVPRKLSLDEIRADSQNISQVPRELLDDPEAQALLLPMLQADFEMYENYCHVALGPLSCPIVAVRGRDDHYVSANSQLAWQQHTKSKFSFHVVAGSHLFMVDHGPELIGLMRGYLDPLLDGQSARSSSTAARD